MGGGNHGSSKACIQNLSNCNTFPPAKYSSTSPGQKVQPILTADWLALFLSEDGCSTQSAMVGLLCRYCSFSTAGAKVFCSGSTAKMHVTHIKSCNTTDTVFKHSDIRNCMQHWLTVLSLYRLGIPSLSAIIVKDKLARSLPPYCWFFSFWTGERRICTLFVAIWSCCHWIKVLYTWPELHCGYTLHACCHRSVV